MAVHHSTFEQSMQAALLGPDTQRVARPTGPRQTNGGLPMSKLARVLAVGALLTAMSLGGTAYAQDGDAPSQQAAVTQQSLTQAAEPTDTTQPEPTDTTQPSPPVRPLRLRVSPRAGTPGTTVKVTADLRGCTGPTRPRDSSTTARGWASTARPGRLSGNASPVAAGTAGSTW